METLIRCRILWCLIWVCTVLSSCLSNKKVARLIWVKRILKIQPLPGYIPIYPVLKQFISTLAGSNKTQSKRRPKIVFQDQLSINAGQILQNASREHSAILSTFIKLQFVFKTIFWSIFECPLKTGFTVYNIYTSMEIDV